MLKKKPTKQKKKIVNKSKTSSVLEHLFGSRTRVQLLYTFLNQPERSFYVRELARRVGSQINAVRRELESLKEDNFIVLEKNALTRKASTTDKKFYSINQNFVLFPELKALFSKSHLFLGSGLIEMLERSKKLSIAILTGSFVGNNKTETDLLIVGSIDIKKLQDMVREFERDMGFEINYTLMSDEEYKYRKDIGDQFLYRILENKHIVVFDNL